MPDMRRMDHHLVVVQELERDRRRMHTGRVSHSTAAVTRVVGQGERRRMGVMHVWVAMCMLIVHMMMYVYVMLVMPMLD